MARKMEPDLLALSQVAAKWLATLQHIASNVESHDTLMDIETGQACTEITKTADAMRSLITECEKKLLNKVMEARETFKKQAANAKKECGVLKNTASSLKMSVERLKAAKSPLRTALHAPIAKQKMLQQLDVAVPSVQWTMNRTSVKPWEASAGNAVGSVGMETSVQKEKPSQSNDHVTLQPALQITNLQYKGEYAVGGIAPIYGNMVCVTHYDKFLWVYTGDRRLKRKVFIPEIESIYGVVAVDGDRGKIALVDNKRKVHFVTLSADLEVQQHTTKDVPLKGNRISLSDQRQLIVSRAREKEFAVLPADGDESLHTVRTDISDGRIGLESTVQTKVGYVICDWDNKKVYFTDREGHVKRVSDDWERPRCAVVTSWGHVLIADYRGHEIKVFSEVGDSLGILQDNSSQMKYPQYIHTDEAEGLLYVACGPEDARELRKYRFTAGDLPPLPITRSVTKTTMTVNLAAV